MNLLVSGQTFEYNFQQKLDEISTLRGEDFDLAVDTFYFQIERLKNKNDQIALAKKMFRLTQNRKSYAHIRSLCNLMLYTDSTGPLLFAEAYHLAGKLEDEENMAWVGDRRVRFFRKHQVYDSAMIYLWRLRDQYGDDENNEVVINTSHLLGDVYYDAKLYSQAENIYIRILQNYQKKNVTNHWRPFVILNNLGQIGLHTNNLEMAEKWFQTSLSQLETNLSGPERWNIKAYILSKLAETFLLKGDINGAVTYIMKAESLPQNLVLDDAGYELSVIKSRILLQNHDCKGALVMANKAIEIENAASTGVKNIQMYRLLADIHKCLGNADKSLLYMQRFVAASDSIERKGTISRSLLVITEKRLNDAVNRLEITKKEISFLMVLIILLVAVVIFIGILYLELYKSKLALVKKSLQKNRKFNLEKRTTSKNETQPEPNNELVGLVESLNQLMANEKHYLDPQIDIQKLAKILATNRTYLSKAINNVLQTNFPGYINDLRIQEAIRLISEGFTVNYTQEALAAESGFNNRTVFISAFKKYTGVTPSFFISNFRKMDS